MSDFQTAPQRDGFQCQDPDFGRPIPGSITHWPDKPVIGPIATPVGLLADPWDKAAAKSSWCPRNTLPPVTVLGNNPPPPCSKHIF